MPHDVTMPQLGMAQDSGRIVGWRKKPGDPVDAGDILLEIETDKATVEIEAGKAGFVSEILADAGSDVPVGDTIAVISDQPGAVTSARAPDERAASKPAVKEVPTNGAAAQPIVEEPATQPRARSEPPAPAMVSGSRILASAKAKWEAHRRGLNLADLASMGIPQPFHVADLDRLSEHAAAADRVPAASPSASQIRATIGSKAFDEFVEWAGKATDGAAHAATIWAAFAGSAWRQSGLAVPNDGLVVECGTLDDDASPVRLLDPDRHGLGRQVVADDPRAPDLRIHDLTGSALQDYRPGDVQHAPVLVITSTGTDQRGIALNFQESNLSLAMAVQVLESLVSRAHTPTLHLL